MSNRIVHMDESFIREMKTALEKERAEVQQELNSVSGPDTGDHMPGDRVATFPNYGDDVSDDNTASPAEVSEYEANLDITSMLSTRLQKIEAALERIAQGTYGKRKDGGMIAEDRLRANPAAED